MSVHLGRDIDRYSEKDRHTKVENGVYIYICLYDVFHMEIERQNVNAAANLDLGGWIGRCRQIYSYIDTFR